MKSSGFPHDRGSNRLPPLERLEAMLAERSLERARKRHLYAVSQLIADGEPFEPWARAILVLRDRRAIGPHEALYFLTQFGDTEIRREYAKDDELRSLEDQISVLDLVHGLFVDLETAPEPPDEWYELGRRKHARTEKLLAERLREFGESDFADLIEHSHSEFAQQWLDGYQEFKARWPSSQVDT